MRATVLFFAAAFASLPLHAGSAEPSPQANVKSEPLLREHPESLTAGTPREWAAVHHTLTTVTDVVQLTAELRKQAASGSVAAQQVIRSKAFLDMVNAAGMIERDHTQAVIQSEGATTTTIPVEVLANRIAAAGGTDDVRDQALRFGGVEALKAADDQLKRLSRAGTYTGSVEQARALAPLLVLTGQGDALVHLDPNGQTLREAALHSAVGKYGGSGSTLKQ